MKKKFLKPTIQVVTLQMQGLICNSPLNRVNSNVSVKYGGGGNGSSRSRSFDDWDE